MPPKSKYTDPKLRAEVKEDVKKSDKAGAPGQWSARKAQLMAKEYKERGCDYNTDKPEKDESQKNLSRWNGGDQSYDDGEEPKDSNTRNQKESNKENHPKANVGKARQKTGQHDEEGPDIEKENEKGDGGARKTSAAQNEDAADPSSGNGKASSHPEQKENKTPPRGQKRGRGKQEDESSAKKGKAAAREGTGGSKTVGSKHDAAGPPAKQASTDRLPEKGQYAHWKALPGWVDGDVVEVLKKGKTVAGKNVKATASDPRIVLKSKKSGKICVHRVEAVYFD